MKRKAKKKRLLKLEFVTARTPDECRAVLQQVADGHPRRLMVAWGDAGQFRVERVRRLGGIHVVSRVELDGSLTAEPHGTRVVGYITRETRLHIRRTITAGLLRLSAIFALIPLFLISLLLRENWLAIDVRWGLWGLFYGLCWLVVAVNTASKIAAFPVELLSLLDRLLYIPLNSRPQNDAPGEERHATRSDHAPDRSPAAISELHDRSHAGAVPRHFRAGHDL